MNNENQNILSKRANEMFGMPKDQWMTVDKIIYDSPSYLSYDAKEMEKIRFKAIKESLNHHYTKSQFYNQLCKEYEFKPEDVKNHGDLEKVPMLPDTFFKEYPAENPKDIFEWLTKISTVELGEYDYSGNDLMGFLRWAEGRLEGLVNHSSGTTGHYSFMFRDKITFHRFYYALVKTLVELCPPKGDPHFVFPGSPNTFLTIGKWIGEIAKVYSEPKRHFLTDREISMSIARLMATGHAKSLKERFILRALKKAMIKGEEKMLTLLQDLDKTGEQLYIVSAPFQIYSIMLKMKDDGIKLNLGDSNSFLITGGGWKIFESRKVSENEFAKMVEETLGISPDKYTDLYGMSELNGGAVSCKGRYKHLLPWVYPMVLDDNQGHLGYGEWGRFAFLDPVANSYPGYIITGDKVKMHEKCPSCDKPGPVLESDITRMVGAEAKGCANLMRGLMAEELKKVERKKGF
jgi:phenylacetate-coenzyme A ligase PaaK-like adenylate-forming protein